MRISSLPTRGRALSAQEPSTTMAVGVDPGITEAVDEWRPGMWISLLWILMFVPLLLVGLGVFGAAAVVARGGSLTFSFGVSELVLIAGITIALLVIHEAVHAIAMLSAHAKPRFGIALVGRVIPALYTTADNHRFSRREYLVVALAPTLLLSAIGFVLCLSPIGPWMVLPLALHLTGCVADATVAVIVLRQRSGTRVEDRKDAVLFVRRLATPGGPPWGVR